MDKGQGLWRGVFAGLLLGICLHSASLWAQVSTATISGTASDASGAMLPGVEVVVRNVETGITRNVVTDGSGRFRIPQLSLGSYEVRASLTGFKTEVRSGIVLTVGREAVLDLTLQVGDVAETVEVMAEAPLVETTSAAVSGLVSNQQIRELPLNGRSLEQLAVLQLGVTLSRNAGVGFFSGNVQRINVAGARTSANSFLLDGTDINDFWNNTPGSVAGVSLGVDTIREFKVLVNNYSAEYGRAGGGVITSVTHSGTNQLHGSLFEFLRNNALDANRWESNWANAKKPPFRRNQFGFTAGGPLKRDRAFFFGSYEGLRQRLATTSSTPVPTAATRSGANVHPRSAAYLALLPLPTPGAPSSVAGTQDYVSAISNPTNEDYFMVRLDHRFSDNDSLFGRYTFDNANQDNINTVGTFASPAKSRNQYFTLEETHLFSSRWLNVFRLGVNRSVGNSECETLVDIPSSLDLIPGRPFGSSGGITLATGAGLPGLLNCRTAPHNNWYNLYELSNDMTFTRESHSLKTGLIVKNIRANKQSDNSRSGTYEFQTLTNFLAGVPSQFESELLSIDGSRSWRQTLYGFYLQDDWRARPKLTLNLGLRYEFVTAPIEIHGKASMLLDILDRETTIFGKEPFLPNVSKKNFSPRVGFAYDVFGNGRTAVRGGFGLYWDQILPVTYSQPAIRNRPFFTRLIVNATPTVTIPYPDAYSALLVNAQASNLGTNNFTPTDTPYLMQYNFSIQQQLAGSWVVNLGYIGSRGVHLISVRDANSAFPTIQSDGRKFFPTTATPRNPNIAEVSNYQTDADSRYDALAMGVNQRFQNGLQIQMSFTFAKMLDNASGQYAPESSGASGRTSGDPDDLRTDWSLSSQHVSKNFVVNSTYALPFGSALTGIAGQLVKGWQLNGILTLSAGTPRSVTVGFDHTRTRGNGFTPRPNLVAGKSNNPVIDDVAVRYRDPSKQAKYLDPSSFALHEAGYFGNLARNTIIGPGLATLDAGVSKNFPLFWEGAALQFRSEFFNLLNRVNLSQPLTNLCSNATSCPRSDFGLIGSTRGTSRQIQFGLKMTF